MRDLKLIWSAWGGDCALNDADLRGEDDLETAVILSLMCDARARDDDAPPSGNGDRRGWWADSVVPTAEGDAFGSRLWLLSREKTVPEVLRRAKDYAEEALAWMIADKAARTITVTASMPRQGLLALDIALTLPDGSIRTLNLTRSL